MAFLRILILITLLAASFFMTLVIKNQFPSVTVDFKGTNITSNTEKSTLHYYCDKKYNNSMLAIQVYSFDGNYVKGGDEISVQVRYDVIHQAPGKINAEENYDFFVGTNKNNLKKLKVGINNIDLIYSDKNITIYELMCYNNNDFASGNTVGIVPQFTRPSFVESWPVLAILFLGTFFLIEQFLSLILKWIFGKNPLIE
jgi:hypothetical protein